MSGALRTAGSLCAGSSALAARLPDGNRVRRESQARFCERLEVKAHLPAQISRRPCSSISPNYPFAKFLLAAALAHLGRVDQARAVVKEGLALDPNFTIRRFRAYPL